MTPKLQRDIDEAIETDIDRSHEFKCAECGNIYERAWTDEEASVEFAGRFPSFDIRSAAIVCDDCYKKCVGEQLDFLEGEEI